MKMCMCEYYMNYIYPNSDPNENMGGGTQIYLSHLEVMETQGLRPNALSSSLLRLRSNPSKLNPRVATDDGGEHKTHCSLALPKGRNPLMQRGRPGSGGDSPFLQPDPHRSSRPTPIAVSRRDTSTSPCSRAPRKVFLMAALCPASPRALS